MRAPRMIFIAALLLLTALLQPAFAKEGITLLTPFDQTVVRQGGSPTDVTQTVTVPTTAGQWWLSLESPNATSATVVLNGATVFGPSNVKGPCVLRATVQVAASNTIEVRLAGKPGDSVHVHLDGVVPDSSIPASMVHHVFQKTFFTQQFTGSGAATITLPTAAGLWWLDVQNGTAQGTNRVSSGTVVLDGATVFGPSDFSPQVGALEAPVIVALTNQLAVTIQAPKGGDMTASLRGYAVDTTPPSVRWVAPGPGWHRLVGNAQLVYSDDISGVDTSSLIVTMNGAVVNSAFAITPTTATAGLAALYPPLHEGSNLAVATLSDIAVNTTTTETTILIDTVPPTITLFPGDGAVTGRNATFTATIVDPSPGSGAVMASTTVLLDGVAANSFAIVGNTVTIYAIGLASGSHTLSVSCLDVAGNLGQTTIHFRVVSPPKLTVIPADGSVTNSTFPAIIVTVTPDVGTQIATGSVTAVIDTTTLTAIATVGSSTAFLPETALAEGLHQLTVQASDTFGDTATLETSFSVELTATHLGLTIAPADSRSVLVYSLNSLTVAALTSSGLVASGFTGTIQITTSDGLGTFDQLMVDMTEADQGVVTIPNLAIVREPGPLTIDALDLDSPTITGTAVVMGSTIVPQFTSFYSPVSGQTYLTIQSVPFATLNVIVDGQIVQTISADLNGVATTSITLTPGAHSVQISAFFPDPASAGYSAIATIGPSTTVSGVVLNGSGSLPVPLPGVPVSLEGTPFTTLTDASGRFSFSNVAIGNYVLDVDGYGVPGGFGLSRVGVSVMGPTVVPAFVLQPVDFEGTPFLFTNGNGAILTMTVQSFSVPGARLQIPGGTATLPQATVPSPTVTITNVSLGNLPVQAPAGLAAITAVSLGPEGTTLSGGFTLTLPNPTPTRPQSLHIWHYVPELRKWQIVGDATPQSNGTVMLTVKGPAQLGIYAAEAPNATTVSFEVQVFDEQFHLVPLTDPVVFSGPAFVTSTPKLPGIYQITYSVPSIPATTTLIVTRGFSDGTFASVNATFQVITQGGAPVASYGNGWVGQIIYVRVGHLATIGGVVEAPDHNKNPITIPFLNPEPTTYPVRLAQVFCNGAAATTDPYGRFQLSNVQIWAPYPDFPPTPGPNGPIYSSSATVGVSADKVAGATLRGGTSFVPVTGPINGLRITIDGDFTQGSRLITSTVVSSQTGTDANLWPLSLLFDSVTGNFYTANGASASSILEIVPDNTTPWNVVASGISSVGLQANSIALAPNTVVKNNGVGSGERLWVVDGNVGAVYLLGIQHSATNYVGNFGQIEQIANNLLPNSQQPALPLAAPLPSGGNLLVNFNNLWDEVDTLNGAHLLGAWTQSGALGITNTVDVFVTEDIALGLGNAIVSLNWENTGKPIDTTTVLPLSFTPEALTAAPQNFGGYYFAAIVPGPSLPGFALPVGASVALIRASASSVGQGDVTTVYSAPQGSNKHVFGLAWGPGPQGAFGQDAFDLYVLQSDIDAANPTGSNAVTAEIVKVESVGGWANAFNQPFTDTDGDGLPDPLERLIGSDPTTAHSDGNPNGIDDYVKFVCLSIPPTTSNFAGDGVPDWFKFVLGVDYTSFVPVSVGLAPIHLVPGFQQPLVGTVTVGNVPTTNLGVTLVSTNPAAMQFIVNGNAVSQISNYTGGPITVVGGPTVGAAGIQIVVNGVPQPGTQTVSVINNPDTTPPVVTILSPTNNSSVGTPEPLIMISYFDPQPGSGINTTTGISVTVDGVLATIFLPASNLPMNATFFPSVPLGNGPHTIVASVFDNANNLGTATSTFNVSPVPGDKFLTTTTPEPADNACSVAGGAYLSNGQVHLERVDLAVPGRGEASFAFTRVYKSYTQNDAPMGQGWTHCYDMQLKRLDPNNPLVIRWLTGTGRAERFILKADGTYESPTGFFCTLLGSDSNFVIREPHGTRYFFYPLNDAIAPGRLQEILDRHGNYLKFAYGNTGNAFGRITTITDAYDRVYTLTYNANQLLQSIQDYSGRTVTYTYAQSGGTFDLVEVTGPAITQTTTGTALSTIFPQGEGQFPNGKSEVYAYTSGNTDARLNHKLLLVVAPNQASSIPAGKLTDVPTLTPLAWLANTWTTTLGPDFGRIASQRIGDQAGTVGGTFTFTDQALPLGTVNSSGSVETLQVTVLDRAGNKSDHFLNASGQCVRCRQYSNRSVRPNDAAFFETMWTFNGDGLRTSTILPLGNSEVLTYDSANALRSSQANVLKLDLNPDARGDSTGGTVTRTVIMTYEPIYNQVRAVIDERGNTPNFVVQNDPTNASGVMNAVRFQSVRFFDYQQTASAAAIAGQTGLDPTTVTNALAAANVPLLLGDINQDGSDDTFMAGDVIKAQNPSVTLTAAQTLAIQNESNSHIQPNVTLMTHNRYGQPTRVQDAENNVHTFSYNSSSDPSNSGTPTPGTAQTDPSGGYLATQVVDAQSDLLRENQIAIDTANFPVPAAAALKTTVLYDTIGDTVDVTDGRGITHQFDFDLARELVRTQVATSTFGAYLPQDRTLPVLNYTNTFVRDANGNVTEKRVGNQGERTGDGMFVAGNSYWSTVTVFNLLDMPTAVIREVTPIADGVPVTATSPGVTVTQIGYDPNMNVTKITKPMGNIVTSVFDERDLVFTVTRGFGDPLASTTTRNYDLNGHLQTFVDAVKNDTGINTAFPAGDVTQFAYDGFDRLVKKTDAENNVTDMVFDPSSHPVRSRRSDSSGTRLAESMCFYDELGRGFQCNACVFTAADPAVPFQATVPTIATTAQGNDTFAVSTRDLDRLGRTTRSVDIKQADTLVNYDGAGRRVLMAGPLTGFTPLRTDDEIRSEVATTYDGASNVIRTVELARSPLTLRTGVSHDSTITKDYVRDAVGRVSQFVDSMAVLNTSGQPVFETYRSYFDSRSNVIAQTDPKSGGTPVTFAQRNNALINVDGNVTRAFYDGLSRPVTVERFLQPGGQGDGKPHLTETDAELLPSVVQATTGSKTGIVTTQIGYDLNSRVTSQTDANGNITGRGYDALDRCNMEVFADLTIQQTKYDADDNVFETIDPNGTTIDRTYDGLSRLVKSKVTKFGTGVVGTTFQAFSWDGLSRLVGTADDNGSGPFGVVCGYSYDSISRLLQETQTVNIGLTDPGPVPGGNGLATVTQTLNPLTSSHTVKSGYVCGTAPTGVTYKFPPTMPVRTSCTYPDGHTLNYAVDGCNRIQEISQFDQAVFQQLLQFVDIADYQYFGFCPYCVLREYLNQIQCSYTYFKDCKLCRLIQALKATTNILSATAEYDALKRFQTVDFTGGVIDPTLSYSYDSLSRVTGATITPSGGPASTSSYQFDGADNFVQKSEGAVTTNFNSSTGAYAPDLLNRYTSIQTISGGVTTTDTPTYDLAGEEQTSASRTCSFDAFHRLVNVTTPASGSLQAGVGFYQYDAGGRRVGRTATLPTGGQIQTVIVWDGTQEIEEYPAGPGTAPTARYVYGATDVDEVIEYEPSPLTQGHPTYFYHQDFQQSVLGVTDINGNVVEQYAYTTIYGVHSVFTPSGQQQPIDGTIGNPFRFQGRRLDPESGLYYFRRRYLDPVEGRFVNRDPIGIWGDPGSMGNGYAFEGGNPVNRRDPFGLEDVYGPPNPNAVETYERWDIAQARAKNRPPLVVDLKARTPIHEEPPAKPAPFPVPLLTNGPAPWDQVADATPIFGVGYWLYRAIDESVHSDTPWVVSNTVQLHLGLAALNTATIFLLPGGEAGVAEGLMEGPLLTEEMTLENAFVRATEELGAVEQGSCPTLYTGARSVSLTQEIGDVAASYRAAEEVYVQIRASTSDIAAIAKNTRWSEATIASVKQHIFIDSHVLPTETGGLTLRGFDADPMIADLWRLAEAGELNEAEAVQFNQLIRHESCESTLMKYEGILYRDPTNPSIPAGAHDAAHLWFGGYGKQP